VTIGRAYVLLVIHQLSRRKRRSMEDKFKITAAAPVMHVDNEQLRAMRGIAVAALNMVVKS
jgi:hypothetical protein